MKKILTTITEDEKDKGLSLISLRATYNTMLKITRYPINKHEVKLALAECENNIQKYWDTITNKYKIPLYIDKPMGIDSENNFVYVEL